MKFTLPWPPSINGYWRAFRGRQIISKKGREYRKRILEMIGECECLSDRLQVDINLFPPDRRRRDIDNYSKGVLDALTKAGVWQDDEQIDVLHIERKEIIPDGRIELVVQRIREAGL